MPTPCTTPIRHHTDPEAHSATQVEIRPLRHGEEHLVREMFTRLSSDGRFLRFHSPTPRLTEGLVRGLSRIQHGVRGSLIAVMDGQPVGHALWAREEPQGPRAEVAVAVADAVQGKGVGQELIRQVARHVVPLGIAELTCHIHHDNARVRRLLSALGGRVAKDGVWVLPAHGLLDQADGGSDMLRWAGAVPRPRTAASTDRRRH